MVYNSWATMQQLGEKDANTCQYNDLALIQLDPADAANVNPSVPYWGGPTGLGGSTAQGENVYSYGNSELRGGVTTLSPKKGLSLGTDSGGWNHTVYTATPGIPGDSGSGFLDKSGRGFGILSTVAIVPLAGSNGVGDLANELGYLHSHTSFTGVQLVNGTESFNGGKLPVGGCPDWRSSPRLGLVPEAGEDALEDLVRLGAGDEQALVDQPARHPGHAHLD